MKPNTRLTLGIVGLIVGLISIWYIDISITAIMNNLYLSNGFLNINPAKSYHIGIYTLVLSLFFCVIAAIDGNAIK